MWGELTEKSLIEGEVVKYKWELVFEKYHKKHPEVYGFYCDIARNIQRAGYQKYGHPAVWEVIRYQRTVEVKSGLKMPNNHRAYYVRLWLRDHPDDSGFFTIRRMRSVKPGRVDDLGFDK